MAREVVESFGSPARDIGPIVPGMVMCLVIRGQFSQIDVLRHVLDQVGPADVSLWSATIAEENEATALHTPDLFRALIANPLIRSARLITEHSVLRESADLVATFQDRFGDESVRYASMHAKIITVRAGDLAICVRGSMTLNASNHIENVDICDSLALCDHVREIEDTLPILPKWATQAKFSGGWTL